MSDKPAVCHADPNMSFPVGLEIALGAIDEIQSKLAQYDTLHPGLTQTASAFLGMDLAKVRDSLTLVESATRLGSQIKFLAVVRRGCRKCFIFISRLFLHSYTLPLVILLPRCILNTFLPLMGVPSLLLGPQLFWTYPLPNPPHHMR